MPTNLTILIPTWDRPEEVNQRLREIDAIWQGSIDIVIQVNPGRFDASHIDCHLYSGNILVRQNSHNLGPIPNIVYGIVGIRTDWLWILCDDDHVQMDARMQINEGIRLAEESQASGILFNQWHRTGEGGAIYSKSIETFLGSTGFSDILFITGFVWRFSFFQKNIPTLIDYAYSWSSHTLILIASQVEKSSTIVIIDHSLVHYEYVVRWSRLSYLQRITTIFLHPCMRSGMVRTQLTEILWPQCRWALLSAAHEQLKHGNITMLEWYEVAGSFSLHLLSSSPLSIALRRIVEIFQIPLQIYPLSYIISLPINKLRMQLFKTFFPRRLSR
ncbi:MAG: glycosyltransferase family 2 protein [Cyanobacteriota bacterium]